MKWSWSRLQCWHHCPTAYKLHYVEEQPEPLTDYYRQGSWLHEVIEAYSRHCYAEKAYTDTDWLEARIGLADEQWQKDICRKLQGALWFDWSTTLADEDGIERWFEVPLPNGDLARGRMDMVGYSEYNDTLYITDYKMGFSLPDDRLEVPGQLLVYAWALREQFPTVASIEVRLAFPMSGRDRAWALQPPVEIDWFVDAVEQVKRDTEFPARPSLGNCMRCGYAQAGCPVLRDQQLQCRSQEDAQGLLGQVAAYEGFITQAKTLLKEWADLAGPVSSAGLEASYSETVTLEGDERAIGALIAKHGKDPARYVRTTLLKAKARDLYGELAERGVDPHRYLRLDLGDVVDDLVVPADAGRRIAMLPEAQKLSDALETRVRRHAGTRFGIRAVKRAREEATPTGVVGTGAPAGAEASDDPFAEQ